MKVFAAAVPAVRMPPPAAEKNILMNSPGVAVM